MGSFEDACTAIERDRDNRANNRIGEFFIQHLNSSYCSVLFVLATTAVVAKEVFGEQIKCWCPDQFTDKQVEFTNNYCYVRNTYYVSSRQTISPYPEDRKVYEIYYYPWVPVVLFTQCVLFVIPKWTWMQLQTFSSFSFVSRTTKNRNIMNADDHTNIAHSVNKWILIRMQKKKQGIRLRKQAYSFEISRESYLAKTYVFCCFLYVLNSIGQLFLLDKFLGNHFLSLGTDIVFKRKYEEHRPGMLRFPTVTFCDTFVRRMINIQTYTVQCSLPNNLFNEIIFILTWFLLVLLSIVNIVSLVDHFAIFLRRRRKMFIRKCLLLSENQGSTHKYVGNDSELFDDFLDNYLGVDGVFVISLVSYQLGAVYSSILVENIWDSFNEHKNNDEKTS
ncbi:innexin unc-7-like [Ylistrum balloti]|uniref:innexin unc-7-like n=1 Tax=Ylistrum balloti TaxID=509963 RepID=UPI002905BB08|nr:innexin unc-7-like [Ylistrum balloti]